MNVCSLGSAILLNVYLLWRLVSGSETQIASRMDAAQLHTRSRTCLSIGSKPRLGVLQTTWASRGWTSVATRCPEAAAWNTGSDVFTITRTGCHIRA